CFSAVLLFSIQPLFARMALPLLGGAPAVWNTCLVFFQIALLCGYAYAHLSGARLRPRRQIPLHRAVSAHEVVAAREPTHGWLLAQRRVWSSAIVVLQPAGQHAHAIGGRVIRTLIGPFAQQRLDEALGLAIGARSIGPRSAMGQAERSTGRAKAPGSIGRAVIGRHASNPHTPGAKPRQRPSDEAAHGLAALVGQQLDVRDARVVVHGDVHELPAGAPRSVSAVTGDPVADV